MSDETPGGAVLGVVRTIVPDAIRERYALKFLIVLLVMGLAIGAVGIFATGQITDQTQDRIENEYSSLADQESAIISQWTQRNRQSVKLASNSEVWSSDDNSALERAARNLKSDSTDIDEVHVMRPKTGSLAVVASTDLSNTDSLKGTSREYISTLKFDSIGQVHVTSVYDASGKTVMGFVSPVGNGDRYLVIESSVEDIAAEFQGTQRAEGGFTQVVDSEGTLLIDERMGTDASVELFTTYGDEEAQEPIRAANLLRDQSEPSGVIPRMHAHDSVLNEEYAVGYAPLFISGGPDDLVVLVHAPTSEVFGFAQTISDYGLIATGAAVLFMGLIGIVLGYNTASSIDRLTSKAEEMESGNLDVEIETGRIDNIGRLYEAFASMQDSLKEQIQEAESARKQAEVSRAEAMEMSSYLQERAEEYSEIMQAGARGDLTQRMEPEGENAAMDQIAEDFNEMISELEMTTGQLKTFAEEVGESGQSVQRSAETVRDASEQVAESIQKISDDSYDQKERLRTISEDIDAVAESLEAFEAETDNVDFGDALETVRDVAQTLNTAVELGEETMAESENVAGAAEEQAAELNEVSSRAEELVRYAQYLGDGLGNFETEEEHEFVFQTGAGGTGGAGANDGPEPTDD